MRKGIAVYLLLISLSFVEKAQAFRTTSFSDNQWKFGLQYNEYESATFSGYSSRSRLYGLQLGYRFENEGWAFLIDGSVGNLSGVERLRDNTTIRNLNLQDITWAFNFVPCFNFNVGSNTRIYFGMGAAAEIHFSKLPEGITYTRLLKKDLQFAFGPVYVLGIDFLIGESSRLYFQYNFRSAEGPLYEVGNFKVMGPVGNIGFTW